MEVQNSNTDLSFPPPHHAAASPHPRCELPDNEKRGKRHTRHNELRQTKSNSTYQSMCSCVSCKTLLHSPHLSGTTSLKAHAQRLSGTTTAAAHLPPHVCVDVGCCFSAACDACILLLISYPDTVWHGGSSFSAACDACQNSGVETGNYVDLYRESGDD